MLVDYNILAILTIIVGVVALFFFVIDKYPMESISIGLLSSLAIIQVIFSSKATTNFFNCSSCMDLSGDGCFESFRYSLRLVCQ